MRTDFVKDLDLRDFDGLKLTAGQLGVCRFTWPEKVWRATKSFTVLVVLAFGSAFIPVLHFVLVPLFSFLAVGAAGALLLQNEEIAEAKGTCPYCGEATDLKRAIMAQEFRDSCERCRQLIMVSAAGGRK